MAQYESFWRDRGHCGWPGRPRKGIWVVEGETLLAGVAVLVTEGPYFVLEGFATNPGVSLRTRHSATRFLLESARDLTAMLDSTVIMNPSDKSKGVTRLALRLGFFLGTEKPIFGVFR
jgi:hypothetical protein